ncbi:RHS repeat-associated core domain-containing protein [Streptomyces sp. NPDC002769]|uniref:RHS repeat-associated core domain-containing protein n=1 Tax=Streptomyces sp. NPDC002769 TaxID=3154542 RepID=UPI00332DF981
MAQPYRFAGNYQDPTGLYHLQARYYDANTGRFTQPDPSGQETRTPLKPSPSSTKSSHPGCQAREHRHQQLATAS